MKNDPETTCAEPGCDCGGKFVMHLTIAQVREWEKEVEADERGK